MAADRITPEALLARAEALAECAEHLRQAWTDDPLERAEGAKISDRLESEAEMWRSRAKRFSSWPGDVMASSSKTDTHPQK